MGRIIRVGRDNFALTIFIPKDCTNNCKFCTSKKDYKTHKPNIDKVLESIQVVSESTFAPQIKDVVITGGEPFADLSILDEVLNQVNNVLPHRNVFINTSLPKNTIDGPAKYIRYINDSDIITGISVSRHIDFDFDSEVLEDDYLYLITKSLRINCVFFEEPSIEKIGLFKKRFSNFTINFRADYTKVNLDNLHTINTDIFNKLDRLFTYKYSGGCDVCNTNYFEHNVSYHRGIENSHLELANTIIINDLIIKQDGMILYDWDYQYNIDNLIPKFSMKKNTNTSSLSTFNMRDFLTPSGCNTSGCGRSSFDYPSSCGGGC